MRAANSWKVLQDTANGLMQDGEVTTFVDVLETEEQVQAEVKHVHFFSMFRFDLEKHVQLRIHDPSSAGSLSPSGASINSFCLIEEKLNKLFLRKGSYGRRTMYGPIWEIQHVRALLFMI